MRIEEGENTRNFTVINKLKRVSAGADSGELQKADPSEYNAESVVEKSSGGGLDEITNDEERGSGDFENLLGVQTAPQNIKVDLRAVSSINL